AEGPGLSRKALAGATHRARIPIAADVDSLNVAAAGAIAGYELARRSRTDVRDRPGVPRGR
ncbi:MAG: TrmH family RNA methyltransferase, partial [Nitriliruptoraceae bacterium]